MSVSYAVVVGEGKKMEEQYKQLLKKYDSLLIDHEKLKKEFEKLKKLQELKDVKRKGDEKDKSV